MDFAFSQEQDEFRETLRRFCDERLSVADVRRWMESPEGFDRDVWKQMAEELGLQGLVIPEAHGGQGFGFLELCIVVEELGRQLSGGPYLANVWAALAILHGGSESDQATWLPRIAAGDAIATLATTEASGPDGVAGVQVVASQEDSGFRLTGPARLVLEGHNADLVVVPARDAGDAFAGQISLYVVQTEDDGVSRSPLETLDPTRKQADLVFDRAPAHLLGARGQGAAPLARTLDEARITLAAEMVGGAGRCLEMAVDYAKVRVQFARPIGSFQAIKHKAADVLLEVESAKSAAYWAAWVASQDPDAEDVPSLQEAASLAKAFCGDAYQLAAAESIQIHGGIGFTWEHDAQLYFKRARSVDALLGDATFQRARLAECLGL
jgi:alkylation response protein AidB-like acyl-CoA dehydrogenase